MTKQQTVELLQKQLPGFYSVDQVIKIINDIQDTEWIQVYDVDQIEQLVTGIEQSIAKKLDRMDSDDLVDKDSAEFELCGNEISLSDVRANDGIISEECSEVVREKLLAFLKAPVEAV